MNERRIGLANGVQIVPLYVPSLPTRRGKAVRKHLGSKQGQAYVEMRMKQDNSFIERIPCDKR